MKLEADPDWTWRAEAVLDRSEGEELLHRAESNPGEVVMVLQRPDGAIWLQTKEFYPEGIHRLPTGALEQGEDPDSGFERELYEEAGIRLHTKPSRVAVIGYSGEGGRYEYESCMYIVREVADEPAPTDESERIAGWRAIPFDWVAGVAGTLRGLSDGWEAWGEFRAVAHDVLAALPEARTPGTGRT